MADYLARRPASTLAEVCIAVAGPVDREAVDLPNSHWVLNPARLELNLGAPLSVINDFTAQILSLELLRPEELVWFGAPRPREGATRVVVGPGTGLGVAVRTADGTVIGSEAGHITFAPTSEHEIELLRVLFSRYRRLSVERLASGPGLENLYWANRKIAGEAVPDADEPTPARRVAELAAGGDPVALRSVEDFFDILASFAGDMALAVWATGGVYLSGGVFRRLRHLCDTERFRARFGDKGRFTGFCHDVPVAWIGAEHPGLLGCAAALAAAARGDPAPRPPAPEPVAARNTGEGP